MPSESGKMEVYFCPKANCTKVFLENINNESKCAFYDMSENFADALKKKNADVLVYYENQRGFGQNIYGRGLMHNKFCVTGKKVITGSFNPTKRGELYNNNNVIVIESFYLAENYLNEFYNIKNGKKNPTPHPIINFSGFVIKNYFCPRDGCQQKVLSELEKSRSSIYFMVFSFTDNDIGELIVKKHNSENVDVKGVLEKSQNSQYNKYPDFIESGMNVFWDSNPYNMHHKVFIIDTKTVITGSYNPTKNANEKNYENILIIDNQDVAGAFLEEFENI